LWPDTLDASAASRYPNTPSAIREPYTEALVCNHHGLLIACDAMIRTTLEQFLKWQDGESQAGRTSLYVTQVTVNGSSKRPDLVHYINQISNTENADRLKEAFNRIRESGNKAVHRGATDKDASDRRDELALLHMLFRYVFEMPAEMQASLE
jgi:hypothetical protein